METRIEQTILKNLIQNEEFTRKCIPFLKSEYFTDTAERTIYEFTYEYFQKYTKPPTVEALLINLDKSINVNDKTIGESQQLLEKLSADTDESPFEWVVNETEQWCKDRAIYLAVM